MFTLDDFKDEELVSEEMKERIINLDESQQEEFVKSLGERISSKYNQLSEKEQLDLLLIDKLIVSCAEEILDELENKPVDNWKNGLDLL